MTDLDLRSLPSHLGAAVNLFKQTLFFSLTLIRSSPHIGGRSLESIHGLDRFTFSISHHTKRIWAHKSEQSLIFHFPDSRHAAADTVMRTVCFFRAPIMKLDLRVHFICLRMLQPSGSLARGWVPTQHLHMNVDPRGFIPVSRWHRNRPISQ